MKRLIYAEDAMHRIEMETRFYSGTYAEIERAIDSAPTVEPEQIKSEWVSVKDRLPDVFDEVLVYDTFSNTSISIAWRETTPRKNGIVDWYWNSQMSYPEDLTHVTHWMPLPEPPTKQTKGE